jgi:hypothetical protein
MHESDTYLAIVDEGQEKHAKKAVLLIGEKRLGRADESVKARLAAVTDLDRLDRMLLQAVAATNWQETLDTP